MAQITIPIVLDASASAQIFAETLSVSDSSYVFTANSSSLTYEDLSGFLRYIDQDDGTQLFTYQSAYETTVQDDLHADISNINMSYNASASVDFPNSVSSLVDSTLGEMLIKYIASALFGHPEAQAPIKNDATILQAVQTDSDIHGQFTTELTAGLTADATTDASGATNEVVQSIFEQIVNYDLENDDGRFDMSHTDTYVGMPFQSGDTIIFLINMTGNVKVEADTYDDEYYTSSNDVLSTIISSTPDIKSGGDLVPKIWELRITIA